MRFFFACRSFTRKKIDPVNNSVRKNSNSSIRKTKNILVAPLDWGLGHTARCMPLIQHIQAAGHTVIFAGNESQRSFVRDVFSTIATIHLDGYDITYSKLNRWLQAGLMLQLPHIVKTIKKEHEWLERQVGALELDGVISDNRYGLYHHKVPSVIMTHQLQVQTGVGKAMDNVVRKLHYNYLNWFHETWVVDTEGEPNLAGRLSHPQVLPERAQYLGLLSRFADNVSRADNMNAGGRLLVLLSGPEPLRSQLSAMLWRQVKEHNGQVTFVEGSENVTSPENIPDHISYHKRLTGDTLLPALQASGMVICRSGYSTLMDMAALGKKAILIPTPGQTEQEYLGGYMKKLGWYYSTPQAGFDLEKTLEAAKAFSYHVPELGDTCHRYKTVLDGFLNSID